jgi:hypothetical protein
MGYIELNARKSMNDELGSTCKKFVVFRCYLRFSISKEHPIIAAKMTLDTTVAFYTTCICYSLGFLADVIALMWRKEHLQNFSVFQRVHSSNIFLSRYYPSIYVGRLRKILE